MSGHNDYSEVRSELYVDSQVCLLVYDVTNKASFDNLDYWLKEITHFTPGSVDIVIVANKVSLRIKAICLIK